MRLALCVATSLSVLALASGCALTHRGREGEDVVTPVDRSVADESIDTPAIVDVPFVDNTVVDNGPEVVEPVDVPPACTSPRMMCGSNCVDTTTDTANCGACNRSCVAGQTCSGGACQGCATGMTSCNGSCVDTNVDGNNCGTCGNACGASGACSAGTCQCTGGTTNCSGSCVNLQSDANNCGACGHACPMGGTCAAGACMCAGSTMMCGDSCVDVATDDNNCGSCGHACGPLVYASCSGGHCACLPAATECPGGCSYLRDNANCGSCGHACQNRQNCGLDGQCH